VIITILICFFFLGLGLVLYLIQAIREDNNPSLRPRRPPPGNPRLHRRLVELLNGDDRAALRLFRGARRRNPGRSADWCLEKCIHDLMRDRG
jgi:hypothetical protein